MKIDIPDDHAQYVGSAMVSRAAQSINMTTIVPAWLHKLADSWDKGLRFSEYTFWEAVLLHDERTREALISACLIEGKV